MVGSAVISPEFDSTSGECKEGTSGDGTTTVTEWFMSYARMAKLFPSRATLLTVKEQHQSLLLCLARRNKEVRMMMIV